MILVSINDNCHASMLPYEVAPRFLKQINSKDKPLAIGFSILKVLKRSKLHQSVIITIETIPPILDI